jgi:small ligand-binding sensory domain FIST
MKRPKMDSNGAATSSAAQEPSSLKTTRSWCAVVKSVVSWSAIVCCCAAGVISLGRIVALERRVALLEETLLASFAGAAPPFGVADVDAPAQSGSPLVDALFFSSREKRQIQQSECNCPPGK